MMLYLDNAATTLKKPLLVYATLFKSTLFSGGNAGRGGHKMSMDAVRAIVDTQDLIAQLFNIKKAENIVLILFVSFIEYGIVADQNSSNDSDIQKTNNQLSHLFSPLLRYFRSIQRIPACLKNGF